MAIAELFYDVFKGLGEIGSEFVRVPNVGQLTGESSKASQRVYYPARPENHSEENDKIVGSRASKGVGRMTAATLRSPMTFTVAMAQGAHNAPKMWGDKTVRPQEKITGLGSGLKVGIKVRHNLDRYFPTSIQILFSPCSVIFLAPHVQNSRMVAIIDAADEFSYNSQECVLQTYDGVTGLVTQPILGAQEEGGIGLAKGVGKGLMGAIVKPFAGWF